MVYDDKSKVKIAPNLDPKTTLKMTPKIAFSILVDGNTVQCIPLEEKDSQKDLDFYPEEEDENENNFGG